MTRKLNIETLGPFALRWPDGKGIALPARKAQALLAYLAVEQRATREQLANLFWGEHREERARHNLRQALSKIRAVCGPVIRAEGDQLSLDLERCRADVVEFNRLARLDDPESLEGCLSLFRGEFMEGTGSRESAFEEWLRFTRVHLRNTACDAMDRYVRGLLTNGKYQQAIQALNRRLAVDPACEPAHRDLMVALDRVGRRSDALRQYELCAEALHRELGVEPSAETVDLLAELRRPRREATKGAAAGSAQTAATPGEAPRVAVLPFENLSGDDQDYFVDGITEDIITALSRFHSLQVIARGSTFVYKNSNATDKEISDTLGSKFLVRGSVRRYGEQLRINVQLLDGAAGLTLWAGKFDLQLAQVFEVQDEITATVVSTLAGRVEATQLERARRPTSRRLRAYDYLLRGKDHHHRFTAGDCAACIDLFEQSIDSDPDYAVAHAWLACGLGQAMVWGLDEQARLVDRAQAAAERGLELDENEAECHRILAQVHLTRGNLPKSLGHQERALFLNPNDDRSVCSMGEILCYAGRHEEAEQWVRQSMRLNPYHPQRYLTHLARALYFGGRQQEALDVLDQIGRPRQDDLLYAIAASAELGDPEALRRNVRALQIAFPDLDIPAFLDSQPYARATDRGRLRDALAGAGLPDL